MYNIKSLSGRRWFIWTVVAVVVVLGSLALYIYYTADVESSQVTENFVYEQPVAVPADWQTYSGKTHGAGFMYPKGFEVSDYQSGLQLSGKNETILVNFNFSFAEANSGCRYLKSKAQKHTFGTTTVFVCRDNDDTGAKVEEILGWEAMPSKPSSYILFDAVNTPGNPPEDLTQLLELLKSVN